MITSKGTFTERRGEYKIREGVRNRGSSEL